MCRLQALASGHNDILAEAAEMLHEITHDGRGKEVCFAFSSLSLNQCIFRVLYLIYLKDLDHRAAVSWVRHNRFRRNFRHLASGPAHTAQRFSTVHDTGHRFVGRARDVR